MTRTSWNCARNRRHAGAGFSAASSLRPYSLEPRSRFGVGQPAPQVGAERRDDGFSMLSVRLVGIR